MTIHRFHLVNVFAETPLSGNPLAVFEDGSGLDDATMLAMARQLNLPEIAFFLPPTQAADTRIRIFNTAAESTFVGHPTLGSAHVWNIIRNQANQRIALETHIGIVPVWHENDIWTFQAKTPTYRACNLSSQQLAAILGLQVKDITGTALFVSTGAEQLVVPLASRDAIMRCAPKAYVLEQFAANRNGQAAVYVWHRDEALVSVRFFHTDRGSLIEDHGTGSACANLGGWLLANGVPRPIRLDIRQGHTINRLSTIRLEVDQARHIYVGGRVAYLGAGELML
ncbi:PhzF family phenazine biosynthesis protein [Chitinivorax tropicus]|uniref:PhzF family phenazine biosynthesis protein n=1 Tax=Chitinivorax tropicus TaxID=714531 RepID=A0A840MI05_9PROT|nr:PhzF family phenazine biosynthesis protein [Chitinivorax tropicus]MBB5017155.1 PhzF family phenazine biosynthesis protein [Chitinivorax tropicus]